MGLSSDLGPGLSRAIMVKAGVSLRNVLKD